MGDLQTQMSSQSAHPIQASSTLDKEAAPQETTAATIQEPPLPRLSAADFRTYNKLAEQMEYYHNHFRQSWNTVYKACVANKRPPGISLKQFINMGLSFISQLTMHHGIEEQHYYPQLAVKMHEFRHSHGSGKSKSKKTKATDESSMTSTDKEMEAQDLLQQHREIHAGMDVFEDYLRRCQRGEVELELRVLKEQMDGWATVLWTHLDQEVRTLGAENMRKYWSLDEMKRLSRNLGASA